MKHPVSHLTLPIPALHGFDENILRLVKGARESRAIQSGQVDAILDPASGRAILLPDAQASLIEHHSRFRSLVELSTDGYWEQDRQYRFVMHAGAAIGNASDAVDSILGKTLWELPFENHDEVDWQTHRTQLEWRAIFRDLEFKCLDRHGKTRIISISGEPKFDTSGLFAGYCGITRELAEQRSVAPVVSNADRFARITLDTLTAQICVLDATGIIITANSAWRALAATHRSVGADTVEGGNYLSICDEIADNGRVDAQAMCAGIRQVIAGERELFRYEYSCQAVEPRWFMATVARLQGDDAARAIVSYEDITEIKQAEQLLRLECTVARCLTDASTVASGLQGVIRAACEAQGWDCGRYYRLDSPEHLKFEDAWGLPSEVVQRFLEKSHGVMFRSDAGWAGRVYESGQPLWVATTPDQLPPRTSAIALAHELGDELGMHGAFLFPVMAKGVPLGVLAFTARTLREPDQRLLQTARGIGDQLGRYLQHQQTEATLRRSEERFRRLTEIAADWHWEQDTQFRFTKVVGGGMAGVGDILGKTLWELPGIELSDIEWIKHKSELEARWSYCDFECAIKMPDGEFDYYRISGEPLYDSAGAFSGYHGTGLDITQRKRDEIAARVADLSASPAAGAVG